MFHNAIPVFTGDHNLPRLTSYSDDMNDHWTSFDSEYPRDVSYPDHSSDVSLRWSKPQNLTNMQRFLHSDEHTTARINVEAWAPRIHDVWASPYTAQENKKSGFPILSPRPVDYPTPPWNSPLPENSAMDRDSLSSGSVWSPRTSETYPDHEAAFVQRMSPASEHAGYDPCYNVNMRSSFSGHSPGGPIDSVGCIEPSAIYQYPDPEFQPASEGDGGAPGQPSQISAEPIPEMAGASRYGQPLDHPVKKKASVLSLPRDSGVGSSIHGTSIHSYDVEDDDVEMREEYRDDDGSDYKPLKRNTAGKPRRSSRMSKPKTFVLQRSARRSSDTLSRPAGISKPTLTSQSSRASLPSSFLHPNQNACDHCSHICSSTSTLAKHVLNAHTRPLVCTFARYGCPATFGSKNEYKRHVTSQHLRPGIYRCDIGSCIPHPKRQRRKSSSASLSREGELEGYNEFNRKDLFTQHVRRMHAPGHSAPKAEKDAFEGSLEEIRTRCWIKLHDPPPRTVCGFCPQGSQAAGHDQQTVFEGKTAWEERMEHIARHLEKGDREEVEDTGLRDWMIQEGLMDWVPSERRWRVVGTGKRRLGDEDAEGDSE